MKELLPIVSFVAGATTLAFLYGAASVQFKLFPYPVWQNAIEAAAALSKEETIDRSPDDLHVYSRQYPQGGVTTNNPNRAFQGYTLLTAYTGEKCTNLLVDMEGKVVNEWYIKFSEVWGKAPFLRQQLGDEFSCWQGTHLMPNGDLIASFIDNGTPACGGTVRLDRHSKLVWAMPACTHHDVHLGADGLLYLPGMRYEEKTLFRLQMPNRFPGRFHNGERYVWEPPVLSETIVVASPDGKPMQEISILDALARSDYRGLFSVNWKEDLGIGQTYDPTHLNNVDYITAEWADRHPNFAEEGDLMVSLRNISTLAILDRNTHQVKWALNGPFIRQHDPDLLPNGNILLFDNWGGPAQLGGTRAIELDPQTQQIVWEYAGTSERPLYSEFRGSQQPLPNGNVLITESTGGRILEVSRDKEIVWEYVNKLDNREGESVVGAVIEAQRYSPDDVAFLN
jgi:hypothetical protein